MRDCWVDWDVAGLESGFDDVERGSDDDACYAGDVAGPEVGHGMGWRKGGREVIGQKITDVCGDAEC